MFIWHPVVLAGILTGVTAEKNPWPADFCLESNVSFATTSKMLTVSFKICQATFVFLCTDFGGHGLPVCPLVASVRTRRSVRDPRPVRLGNALHGGNSRSSGENVGRLEPDHLRRDRVVEDLSASGAAAPTIHELRRWVDVRQARSHDGGGTNVRIEPVASRLHNRNEPVRRRFGQVTLRVQSIVIGQLQRSLFHVVMHIIRPPVYGIGPPEYIAGNDATEWDECCPSGCGAAIFFFNRETVEEGTKRILQVTRHCSTVRLHSKSDNLKLLKPRILAPMCLYYQLRYKQVPRSAKINYWVACITPYSIKSRYSESLFLFLREACDWWCSQICLID